MQHIPSNEEMQKSQYRDIPGHYNLICPLYRLDEQWLPMAKFYPNQQDYYFISNYGRVFSTFHNSLVRVRPNRNGYMYINIGLKDTSRVNVALHRAILATFNPISNYELLDVNHKDGNKANNCLYNLEWSTRSENVKHAFDSGLSKKGSDHPNSIYTEKLVHQICYYLEQGYSGPQIIELTNMNNYKSAIKFISKIKTRKAWKHVSCKYNF